MEDDEDEEEEKKEPLSILQIPHDLQIVIFNNLKENDLFQVQKTCRSLSIAARDHH